jgi:hypothetical protein
MLPEEPTSQPTMRTATKATNIEDHWPNSKHSSSQIASFPQWVK